MFSQDKNLDNFMSRYLALAKKSKEQGRMIFNHVCIRVEDIDAAEELRCNSFDLNSFLRPGGETFDSEKEFRVAWLENNNMYLELSEFIVAKAKIAWINIGSVELEVIEPRDEGSVYAQFLRDTGPGIHHVMFSTSDFDKCSATMAENNVGVIGSGELQQTRFKMFDTEKDLGLICEIADGHALTPD